MRQHFQSIRQALSWEWPRILENGFHQMKNWKHEHRSERIRRTKSLLMRNSTKRANRNDEPEDKHGTKTQLHIRPLLLTALQEIDDEKPASVSDFFKERESKPRIDLRRLLSGRKREKRIGGGPTMIQMKRLRIFTEPTGYQGERQWIKPIL